MEPRHRPSAWHPPRHLLPQDGIVIATEKRVSSKLLAPPKSSEKIYTIDDHVRSWKEGAGVCAHVPNPDDASLRRCFAQLQG